jgi:hypothetical protein
LIAQRPYFDSPVKVLASWGLGTSQRSAYLEQLQYAGPVELGHMAQVAVGTKNALAAAVVSLIDARPTKDRPVSAQALAAAMHLEECEKVQEYLNIGEARLQGTVLANRTSMHHKSNPIDTVALAMFNRQVDYSVLVGEDA